MNIRNNYQKRIKQLLGNDIIKTYDEFGQLYIYVKQKNILRTMSVLNSNRELEFVSLIDCFAADFLPINKKLYIYYHLLSYKLKTSIFVITDIPEGDVMQSVTILFENANWFEREIFDMFGIQFNDHPDMRKLLSYNYAGFPLRKSE